MARKDVEKYVLSIVNKIDKSGFNDKVYKEKFKNMNNTDFKYMMDRLEHDRQYLRLFVPLDSKVKLDFENNVAISTSLGFNLFQKLTITQGDFTYTPEVEYPIMYMPVRRASQHILKNFNVHKHRKTRNRLTGQVAGNSASGKLTMPEIQVMQPLGLTNTLNEFLGVRAGDVQASNAFNGILFKNGSITRQQLAPFITKTGATTTLKSLFRAMHINLTL